MRAPLAAPFAKKVEYREIELSTEELLQTRGIDVDANEIEVLQDGTLGYKGRRVLVYIRDVNVMGNREHMPRYHFAFCATLSKMHQNNRGGRYVVASRDTGLFEVNLVGSTVQPKDVRLNVCQNCLVDISWNGFGYHQGRETRAEQVNGFTLVDFFKKYPRDLLSIKPKHSSKDAPVNTYVKGWEHISNTIRRVRGYRCEGCFLDLAAHPRYLHVHHRNGQKNDNRDSNLVALCIGCHAKEPLHGHMHQLPDFNEFRQLYGDR
jgi:hypothetical protein